jgi:hypothetical protein
MGDHLAEKGALEMTETAEDHIIAKTEVTRTTAGGIIIIQTTALAHHRTKGTDSHNLTTVRAFILWTAFLLHPPKARDIFVLRRPEISGHNNLKMKDGTIHNHDILDLQFTFLQTGGNRGTDDKNIEVSL